MTVANYLRCDGPNCHAEAHEGARLGYGWLSVVRRKAFEELPLDDEGMAPHVDDQLEMLHACSFACLELIGRSRTAPPVATLEEMGPPLYDEDGTIRAAWFDGE